MKTTRRFLRFVLAVSALVTVMLAMGITASAAENYWFDLSVADRWDSNEVEYNYTQSENEEVKLNITGCGVSVYDGDYYKILNDNIAGTKQIYQFSIPKEKVITRVEFDVNGTKVNVPVDKDNKIEFTVQGAFPKTLCYGDKQVSDNEGAVFDLTLYLEDAPYTETAVSVSKGIAYSDSYAFVVVGNNGYEVKNVSDDTVKTTTADFAEKNVMTVLVKSTDENILSGKKLYIKTGSDYLFDGEGLEITKSTALNFGGVYYTMVQIVSDEINSEATYTVEIK